MVNHPICKHCGSDCNGVDPSVQAHRLCHVRAKHGYPTPPLGQRCPACDGTGLRPNAPKVINTNIMGLSGRQFDRMMEGLHCRQCKEGIIGFTGNGRR